MLSANKVELLGNVASVELRYTPQGTANAVIRMATNEVYRDKNTNNRVTRTEWHRVVVWGKTAENCAKYVKKGSQLMVEGRLRTRHWDDEAGKRHWITEIHSSRVQFGSNPRSQQEASASVEQQEEPTQEQETSQVLTERDVQF